MHSHILIVLRSKITIMWTGSQKQKCLNNSKTKPVIIDLFVFPWALNAPLTLVTSGKADGSQKAQQAVVVLNMMMSIDTSVHIQHISKCLCWCMHPRAHQHKTYTLCAAFLSLSLLIHVFLTLNSLFGCLVSICASCHWAKSE